MGTATPVTAASERTAVAPTAAVPLTGLLDAVGGPGGTAARPLAGVITVHRPAGPSTTVATRSNGTSAVTLPARSYRITGRSPTYQDAERLHHPPSHSRRDRRARAGRGHLLRTVTATSSLQLSCITALIHHKPAWVASGGTTRCWALEGRLGWSAASLPHR
jgi:hypothetical protein